MLRRLTDAIVCTVLLVLDILAWLIVSTFSSLDRSNGRIASVSQRFDHRCCSTLRPV